MPLFRADGSEVPIPQEVESEWCACGEVSVSELRRFAHNFWGPVVVSALQQRKIPLPSLGIEYDKSNIRMAEERQFRIEICNGVGEVLGDEARIQFDDFDAECYTALAAEKVVVACTGSAFAALRNGKVVTWGDPECGGDSSSVAHLLDADVERLVSTYSAFAALKRDGSVVTWGFLAEEDAAETMSCHPLLKGKLSSGVQHIFGSRDAFAALKKEGSVVVWGGDKYGGDAGEAAKELVSNVQRVFSGTAGFVALKGGLEAIQWGPREPPNDTVASHLAGRSVEDIQDVIATRLGYAIHFKNGSVVSWGNFCSVNGLDVQLSDGVCQVCVSDHLFAALKSDGSVLVWGKRSLLCERLPVPGGDGSDQSGAVSMISSGVVRLFSVGCGFIAQKDDGGVVAWEQMEMGPTGRGCGDPVSVEQASRRGASSFLKEVRRACVAFAGLFEDGSVAVWNWDWELGERSSHVPAPDLKSGVRTIVCNTYAFAALKEDGSVVTWGEATSGGDSSAVHSDLSSGVTEVVATGQAFAAIKEDGTIVTWGDALYGGECGAVQRELRALATGESLDHTAL